MSSTMFEAVHKRINDLRYEFEFLERTMHLDTNESSSRQKHSRAMYCLDLLSDLATAKEIGEARGTARIAALSMQTQRSTIVRLLHARFGELPQSLESDLEKIADSARLAELTVTAGMVNTLDDAINAIQSPAPTQNSTAKQSDRKETSSVYQPTPEELFEQRVKRAQTLSGQLAAWVHELVWNRDVVQLKECCDWFTLYFESKVDEMAKGKACSMQTQRTTIAQLLHARFGELPQGLESDLEKIADSASLAELAVTAGTASTLDDATNAIQSFETSTEHPDDVTDRQEQTASTFDSILEEVQELVGKFANESSDASIDESAWYGYLQRLHYCCDWLTEYSRILNQGKTMRSVTIVSNMLRMGVPLDLINKYTDFPMSEILVLQEICEEQEKKSSRPSAEKTEASD